MSCWGVMVATGRKGESERESERGCACALRVRVSVHVPGRQYAGAHLFEGGRDMAAVWACAVTSPPTLTYEPHTLDAAPSPLIRALPDYERQFRFHLARAQAVLESSQVHTPAT